MQWQVYIQQYRDIQFANFSFIYIYFVSLLFSMLDLFYSLNFFLGI